MCKKYRISSENLTDFALKKGILKKTENLLTHIGMYVKMSLSAGGPRIFRMTSRLSLSWKCETVKRLKAL